MCKSKYSSLSQLYPETASLHVDTKPHLCVSHTKIHTNLREYTSIYQKIYTYKTTNNSIQALNLGFQASVPCWDEAWGEKHNCCNSAVAVSSVCCKDCSYLLLIILLLHCCLFHLDQMQSHSYRLHFQKSIHSVMLELAYCDSFRHLSCNSGISYIYL